MAKNILKSEAIEDLSRKADKFLIENDYENLKTFLDSLLGVEYTFENLADEAKYYYTLGTCSENIFNYRRLNWFSDELSKSVIFLRKALYVIQKIEYPSAADLYLRSCIETNLGNNLSSQGRAFCCIPLWDDAIKCKENPVPIISKAKNELFIARSICDPGHKELHYFTAYQLIQFGLEHLDKLYPEQRAAYSKGSHLMSFKAWYEDNFTTDDFSYFDLYKMDFESRKQASYLKWCGDNKLFINDLNDVSLSEIVYQDIMTLPDISSQFNPTLSMYEELMYHGNFDELKNDYCYARYLVFEAKDISEDQRHLFNSTYPHCNDMAHTITNLKASHYKSAFRTLYSIFDKIAYFINRFFDLNDVEDDYKINFDSIFRQIGKNKWKPHDKLKHSTNCFLHALFYVLKDIRDVKGSTPVSRWLDPDAKAFSEIRNAIEHRSLKIIDDFGYTLTQSDRSYRQSSLDSLKGEINDNEAQIKKLVNEISLAEQEGNTVLKAALETKRLSFDEKLQQGKSQLREQEKLSSHSILIKVSDFESRLMTLMKLARNSIMYLSLAIHFEQKNKLDDDDIIIPREVPLR